jgi:glycosyltransferase involved in cell wall biosynthesis
MAVARKVEPWTGTVRDQALAAFRDAHAGRTLGPVVAVIAALDEQESIARVVGEVPETACGLHVDTLVIDDGSGDETTAVAERAGAFVCRLERNLGHGIALRVGYELASELGAPYIVTLDGDGQWNPAELEGVLAPVVSGEADFVIGSRVLGATETDDAFRQQGVHVFAWLVRILTGVRVTDTSSGFRALRTEVTQRVHQEQVQYQTSELLIGAIAAGYEIAERPIVMRKRFAGESKKGRNWIYGWRYCQVVLRTAWRERRALASRRLGRGQRV